MKRKIRKVVNQAKQSFFVYLRILKKDFFLISKYKMGFINSFSRSLVGMFGMHAVLPESETDKLQTQLSQAQATLGVAFQSGMINFAKETIKLEDQMLKLVTTNAHLSQSTDKFNAQISAHNNTLAKIRTVIILSLIIVVITYLMLSPKCC